MPKSDVNQAPKKSKALAVASFAPVLFLLFIGLLMQARFACGFECNDIRARAEPLFFITGSALAAIVTLRIVRPNPTTGLILALTLILLPLCIWDRIDMIPLLIDELHRAAALAYIVSSVVLGLLTLFQVFI